MRLKICEIQEHPSFTQSLLVHINEQKSAASVRKTGQAKIDLKNLKPQKKDTNRLKK